MMGSGSGRASRPDSTRTASSACASGAASIGARLDFDTNPGGGTAVRVWLDPE